MWSWLATVALAAIPDRLVSTELGVSTVTGNVSGLSVSSDGMIVAGVAGNAAMLVETEGWSATSWSTCSVNAVAPAAVVDGEAVTYVGCTNGTIHAIVWDGEEFAEDTSWTVTITGTPSVEGLWLYNNVLYAASTSTYVQLHRISLSDKVVDSGVTGFPGTSTNASFADAALAANGVLLVQHSAKAASYWTSVSSGGTPVLDTLAFPLRPIADLSAGSDGIWVLDNDSTTEFIGQWTTGATFVSRLTGTTDARAILRSPRDSEKWLGVFSVGGADTSVIYQESGGVLSEYFAFDIGDSAIDAVADPNGDYAFVGTTAGGIRVLTASPWVTVSAAPESASDGDNVDITFTLEEDSGKSVDWQILLGGDRSGDGTVLDEGTSVAGQTVTASVTVGSDWAEGTNWIYVLADEGAETGHGRVGVLVDNPPTTPVLADSDVGVGNEWLDLKIPPTGDADIASFEVYITTTSFDPAAFTTGGPTFDGDDAISNPITVDANGTTSTTVRLSPLTNGTVYYIAVRAIDENGGESALSNVVSGSPTPTSSAADAAGELGGCEKEFTCTTGVGRSAGVAALIPLAWALARRRRGRGAAAALGALVLGASSTAQAADKSGVFSPDTTPAWGNFEARYGMMNFKDPNLTDAFGTNDNNMLRLEFGAQLFRYVEIDVGVGFLQEIDFKRTATGAKSDERQMITWIPLSGDASIRGHFFDEQPLVPFARIGLDLVPWDLKTDNTSGGKDTLNGTKWGWHWGVGGNLLLDWIAPKRASQLEATSGINDTYFTVEYRMQRVGAGATGFDFSGSEITFGLKLDY